MPPTIALVVDGLPGTPARDPSESALQHSIATNEVEASIDVVATDELRDGDPTEFSGLLVGPGSPYANAQAVLDWIREARERGIPLVGT